MRELSTYIRIVVMACILAVSFTSCSSQEEKITAFTNRGDELVSQGEYEKAVLEYQNALQLHPKFAPALFALGRTYLKQEQHRKAYSYYKAVLNIDPAMDTARIEVASLLALAREGQNSMDELEKIVHPESMEPRFSIIKAQAQISMQLFDDAITTLLLTKDGDKNEEVLGLLAIAYREVGSFNKMEEIVRQWQQVAPESLTPYVFMAQHALRQGDTERVREELEEMVKTHSGDEKAGLVAARMFEKYNMIEMAKQAYEGLPRTVNNMRRHAGFLMRMEDFNGAKALLEEVLAKQPDNIKAIVLLSDTFTAKGDPVEGLKALDQALEAMSEKGADWEWIVYKKAEIKAGQGKYDVARLLVEEVITENQGNIDAHLLLGKILLALRQTEKAEIHLNQAAVAQPENAQAQLLLAKSQLINGNESMAEDTIKSFVLEYPKNMAVRMELVRFYLSMNNYEQAVNFLDKGLVENPEDVNILQARGEIEMAQENYFRAKKDFQRLLVLDPELYTGYFGMARLTAKQGDFETAIDWFQKTAERKNGLPNVLPALVGIYEKIGQLSKAVTYIEAKLNEHPETPELHYYLGAIYLTQEKWAECERELIKASELAPRWEEPIRALAKAYAKQNKINEAIVKVEKAYQNTGSQLMGLQLAAFYEYTGSFPKAVRVYEEMLGKDAESDTLLNGLAYLYAEYLPDQTHLEEAAFMVEKCLASQPENHSYLDTVAWVSYQQGKLNTAWSYMKKALERAPEMGVYNLHAALIARSLGQNEKAQEYLANAMTKQMEIRYHEQAQALKKEWDG